MAETIKTELIYKLKNNLFNESFAGRLMDELIDPNLIWDREGFLTSFIGTPAKSIDGPVLRGSSMSARSSPGLNANKVKIPLHAPGTRYPSVSTEGFFTQTYTTNEFGFKASFLEDVRDGSPMSNKIVTQTYGDVARMLSEYTNYEILNGALNSFTYTAGTELAGYMDNITSNFGYETTYGFLCGKLDSGYYWNTDSADYITDIENLKTAFRKQSGYNYTLNRMYMDITLLEDIKLYLYENGHSWEEDPRGGGLNRDTIMLNGVEIIGLNDIDGMSGNEDKVILQDSSVAPCTTYFYTKEYPGFTRWSDVARTAVKTYMESEETNELSVLFRMSQKTVIYYPKAYGLLEVY